MTKNKNSPGQIHVTHPDTGGWNATPAGQQPFGNFDTQAEAINAAREKLVTSGGGELVIHGRDNLIRAKDTIPPAIDRHPPKG